MPVSTERTVWWDTSSLDFLSTWKTIFWCKLIRGDALLDSWMRMNCQSIAALTAGAVRCWSSQSWRQWGREGDKTSAGRKAWSHVRLPLKVRELIRAGQTSVTTCSNCKKIIWRAEEQAGVAGGQLAEQETLDLTQTQIGSISITEAVIGYQGGIEKYYLGM